MTKRVSKIKHPLGISVTVLSILGCHALTLACFPGVSNDLTDGDSETQALDQYAAGPDGSIAYQCGGNHLPSSMRYTDGTTFGRLTVEVDDSLAPTFTKALGAVPSEIGQVMEAFKARIKVTSNAKEICASATKKYEWSNTPAQSCWIADGSGITLVFDAVPNVISQTVVRTFTYAFSEYFVPNISKVTIDKGILSFVEKWTNGQKDLAEAFIRDVENGNMVDPEKINELKQKPTLTQDVTAEAFDSYYCSKESQNTMASRFPQTWKAFTGS